MKLDSTKFSMAAAIAVAVLWVICSAFVMLTPDFMMYMTGHMMHADLSTMDWMLTVNGFFLGLVAWVFCAWITAFLIAYIYNLLLNK